MFDAGKADGQEEILCDVENIADGNPVTDPKDPWVDHLLWLVQRIEVHAQEKALREAAGVLKQGGVDLCAHRRSGEHPYCAGYFERNLRCPDCPEEDGAAEAVLELADACATKLVILRTKGAAAVKEPDNE